MQVHAGHRDRHRGLQRPARRRDPQLKLFPATSYGPRHLQALRTVLPPDIQIYPVGGVAADHIAGWLAAGAAGFGFGSELFRPEYSLAISSAGRDCWCSAFREACANRAHGHGNNDNTGRTA